MSTSTTLTIPPEILSSIFTQIREYEGLSALLPSSRVCQRWYPLARSVLWAHVVLTECNLAKFVLNNSIRAESLVLVRSLTVQLQPSKAESVMTVPHLAQLAAIIQESMTKVASFSLTLSKSLEHPRQPMQYFLNRSTVITLLESLPPTCVSLELDTNAWEIAGMFENSHICPTLRSIMPRLRHLRLHLGTVCEEIVRNLGDETYIQAPNLRTFCTSFFLRAKGPRWNTCECGHRYVAWNSLKNSQHQVRDVPKLSKSLATAVKQGCFPQARQVDVSSYKANFTNAFMDDGDGFPENSWEVTHPLYLELIVLRDCLHDCTYPLPVRIIALGPRQDIAYDRNDECHIGTFWDVVDKAEDAPWGESITGARLPRKFASDVVLSSPGVMSRKEWQAISNFQPVGADWHRDKQEGDPKLQRVVKIEGADAEIAKEKLPRAANVQSFDTFLRFP
jgi:F-box-like